MVDIVFEFVEFVHLAKESHVVDYYSFFNEK
jgi:hypothetical protein